jgi:DNA topoisomerase-1
MTVQEKVIHYNAANREVAILCNHQKTVSKAAELMFENLNEKLTTLKEQRDDLIKWRELAKKKKEEKIPLSEGDVEIQQRDKERIADATAAKDKAVSDAQKLKAVEDLEAAKVTQKSVRCTVPYSVL